MEDLLEHRYGLRRLNGKMKRFRIGRINFVRYADDFIITGSSKEILENEVKPMIEEFLKERGLTLSQDKTKITHISEGFDFLGQNIRKYNFGKRNVKFLIKPSIKNIKAFLTNIRKTIKSMNASLQEEVIRRLTPMITGWANYHRPVVSKAIYNKVDYEIWNTLWRWAARRHPRGKNKTWICNRYFHKVKGVTRAFSCEIKNGDKKVTLALATASEVKIRRHVKIKGAANPFDPAFNEYFEERISWKWAGNKQGKKKVAALWKRQKGICRKCGEPISSVTGWQIHYLKGWLQGGKDNISTFELVHHRCNDRSQQIGFINYVAG